MYEFEYAKPAALDDALKALRAEDSKPVAGGMTFIPVLKQRLNKPSVVVDLAGLGLSGIEREGDRLVIGAMTTHRDVSISPVVIGAIPALADLAGQIGDRQVRYRGTIGGSVANNDPSACYPSAVLALEATIRTDRRAIPAAEYFQGMFTTALEPGELVVSVSFPIPERAAYVKFPNPASRYAMVGVFVAKTKAGARVAVTGAGQGGVFRHAAFEAALDKSFTPAALEGIATQAADMNSDIHGSAEYRAHLVGVIARRAVAAAGG